jgi:hypothetical protein
VADLSPVGDRSVTELRWLIDEALRCVDLLPENELLREGVKHELRCADEWLARRQQRGGRLNGENPLGLPVNPAIQIADGLLQLGGGGNGAG